MGVLSIVKKKIRNWIVDIGKIGANIYFPPAHFQSNYTKVLKDFQVELIDFFPYL
jgi:hypothetical protein